jgi:hypothetical protein
MAADSSKKTSDVKPSSSDDVNNDNLGGFAIGASLYRWICDNLPAGSSILELGSGRGTVELAKRYRVYSVEDDEKWVGHCPGAHYLHAPIRQYRYVEDETKTYNWYDVSKVRSFLSDKRYDLLLVDGPIGPKYGRWGFIENIDLFDSSVPVVVDDTDRNMEQRIANWLASNWKVKKRIEIPDGRKRATVLLPSSR